MQNKRYRTLYKLLENQGCFVHIDDLCREDNLKRKTVINRVSYYKHYYNIEHIEDKGNLFYKLVEKRQVPIPVKHISHFTKLLRKIRKIFNIIK